MNVLDRVIASIAPQRALERLRARAAIGALMNYNAATRGKRASVWRATSADADSAADARQRLSWVSRDMIRNNPFATKAQAVIAGAVVGDGIVYKVRPPEGRARTPAQDTQRLLRAHLESTAIDYHGRCNLYGLQRLAAMAVVADGEVLLRRHWRYGAARADMALPVQVQVLEADFLDDGRDTTIAGGGYIRGGIEFNAAGRRVAYWLWNEHPGATGYRTIRGTQSTRVPASEVIHVYRQDRPGQERGVTWFHAVALQMQDLMSYQEAQLLRQKMAACFMAFRTRAMSEVVTDPDPMQVSTLTPGRIQTLEAGETVNFAVPPVVQGYSEFMTEGLRAVAAGLGITYESLTGDYSRVNFSSGRMGQGVMNSNVSAWQWLLMIPQMMDPLGRWIIEAAQSLPRAVPDFRLEWVPPARFMVDPAKEMAAYADMVAAGFTSRQEVIRRLGYDPEDVHREQVEDKTREDAAGLQFSTSAKPDPVPDAPADAPESAGETP